MAQVMGKKLIVGIENTTRPSKNSVPRSKSKIPKSVRYELENALVNLCDVWFDEIKPHLVRNKIKLHFHQDAAGDDEHKQLPKGAPGCSHIDPGESHPRRRRNVNSAVCCPTQQAASRARYRRPQQDPLSPLHQRLSTSPVNPNHSEGNPKRRTRRGRKPRQHTQSETRLRIPRLCNNFGSESKSYQVHQKPTRCQKNSTNGKTKTKTKYTQTEYSGKPSIEIATLPKTSKLQSRDQKLQANRTKIRTNECPFFKKDLVDFICSKQEDNLEILFKSPTKSEISSALNLIPKPSKKITRQKKMKPWK